MDDFGRALGCLLDGLLAVIIILALAVATLTGLIIAGVL